MDLPQKIYRTIEIDDSTQISIEISLKVSSKNKEISIDSSSGFIAPKNYFSYPLGFAKTSGGFGGRIIRVTNLNESGPGSLREALESENKRIVVFEVSGIIDLKNKFLDIRNPYITIAGQTAPNPGITIIRGQIRTYTHDIIIQHLYIRPGIGAPGKDAIETQTGSYDVIVDHCSCSWGTDEVLSAAGNPFNGDNLAAWRDSTSHRITFSNNIVAAPITNPPTSSGYGTLCEDNVTDILLYGNYFAHCLDRSPNVGGGAKVAVINNLSYGNRWKHLDYTFLASKWDLYGKGLRVKGYITAIGNVGRDGPITACNAYMELVSHFDLGYYGKDNICTKLLKSNPRIDGDSHPETYLSKYVRGGNIEYLTSPEIFPEGLVPMPASEVEDYIHKYCGARPWNRDSIDQEYLNNHLNGIGGLISTNNYPIRESNTRIFNENDWNLQSMTPLKEELVS